MNTQMKMPTIDYLIRLIFKICIAAFCVGLVLAAVGMCLVFGLAALGLSMQ